MSGASPLTPGLHRQQAAVVRERQAAVERLGGGQWAENKKEALSEPGMSFWIPTQCFLWGPWRITFRFKVFLILGRSWVSSLLHCDRLKRCRASRLCWGCSQKVLDGSPEAEGQYPLQVKQAKVLSEAKKMNSYTLKTQVVHRSRAIQAGSLCLHNPPQVF